MPPDQPLQTDVSGPKRVLVVEDEPIVALLMADQLVELGYNVVGPASTISEARHLAETASLDAAIIDLKLHGVFSGEVADTLSRRQSHSYSSPAMIGLPQASMTAWDFSTSLFRSMISAARSKAWWQEMMKRRGLARTGPRRYNAVLVTMRRSSHAFFGRGGVRYVTAATVLGHFPSWGATARLHRGV